MTVPAQTRIARYRGDGMSRAFPIPFRFLALSAVTVSLRALGGRETPVGAVISGGGGNTGTATLAVAPVAGVQVVIRGRQPIEQPDVYRPGDRFPARSHELALDRGTIIDQELRDELDLQAEAIRRLELGRRAIVLDPGIDPRGTGAVLDPGLDPIPAFRLTLDPGSY